MLDNVFSLSSSYIDEGRVILSDEFGKEYGVYFSVLCAISAGRTSFAEIKNIVGTDIGGHLTKLETTYAFISKKQPVFDKDTNKNCLYQIDDCFVRFWFRFIYKYMHLIEQKKLCLLKDVKLDARRYDDTALRMKVAAFFRKHPEMMRSGYGIHGVSVADM